MELADVKKWGVFFLGILVAIIIAQVISNLILIYTGITGAVGLVVSFVLYAALFFAIIYLMERILGIEFFGFGNR